ncbi:flagellar hook-associated protein 2 [Peribacillus sp. SCS-37]|uniref:flagellar hook-associated protein 2 n=1 Tax=Paraperibacillus esterisolvens TaxID=3115296 RepID=UPI003905B58A
MTTRISGLASGMDTDQMIKDLMKAERVPLDKLNQKKQFTEWQRDDFRSISKALFELDQSIFDGIGKQGNYLKKTVSISDPNAVGIKNINSTTDFSGSIKVTQLASSATMFSKSKITMDPKTTLSNYGISGEQTITINAIDKEGRMPANAIEIKFDPTKETLQSVIDKVNKESGVTMFFDSVSQKLSVTAKNSGNAGTDTDPEIVLTGGFLTSNLALEANNVLAANSIPNKTGSLGVNAKFELNGLNTERPSNTFQVNGVEYSLKAPTTTSITYSSSSDVDAVLDTITKFVTKYNETIAKISGEVSETRYRSFQPLTKEQKAEMEEKEIEQWEEKAKSGTLRNDSVLSSGLNQLRTALYTPVSGTTGFSQLSQIGITTTSNYLDKGKLTIDETKLREAIAKDPNAIYELFQKESTTNSTADQGLAQRMRDSIKKTMLNIEKKAGKTTMTNQSFTIGRLLDNMNNSINRFEDRLIQVEDRYYRQFTAMEKAISKANSQSAYIMQQFSGG